MLRVGAVSKGKEEELSHNPLHSLAYLGVVANILRHSILLLPALLDLSCLKMAPLSLNLNV